MLVVDRQALSFASGDIELTGMGASHTKSRVKVSEAANRAKNLLSLADTPHQSSLQSKRVKLKSSKRSQSSINTGKVNGQIYLVSDVVSMIRQGASFSHACGAHGTNPGIDGGLEVIDVMGFAAGAADVITAKKAYVAAKKTGYVWGQVESVIKGVRASAKIVSSANVAANALFDCLTFDGFITASKSSFVAMRVLQYTASAASSFRYMAAFAQSGMNLARAHQVHSKLVEKGTDLKSQLHYLMDQLELTGKERFDIIAHLPEESECQEAVLTEEESLILSERDYNHVESARISPQRAILALKRMAFKKKGKELDLSGRTSQELVQKLRQETCKKEKDKLVYQLERDSTNNDVINQSKDIVKSAQAGAKSRIMMNVIVMSLCVLGVGASIAADVFTVGMLKFVVMGMNMAISAGWLGLDAMMAFEGMRSSSSGKYDAMLQWFINAVAVSVAALALFYTAGTPLLLMGIISATITLSVNFGIWYKNTYGKPLPMPKDMSEPTQIRRNIMVQAAGGVPVINN